MNHPAGEEKEDIHDGHYEREVLLSARREISITDYAAATNKVEDFLEAEGQVWQATVEKGRTAADKARKRAALATLELATPLEHIEGTDD